MQSIKKYKENHGVEVIRFLCCCRCGRMEGRIIYVLWKMLIKEELWLSMYESGLSSDFGEKMRITGIARKEWIVLNVFVRVLVIVIRMQVDSAVRVLYCWRLQAQPWWSSTQGPLKQRRNCWLSNNHTCKWWDSLGGSGMKKMSRGFHFLILTWWLMMIMMSLI